MFTRLITLVAKMQLRHATGFLLQREDDRLLSDIGMTRAELEAMHLGIDTSRLRARIGAFPSGQTLPVLLRS